MNLKSTIPSERVRYKRLSTVQFHLHEIIKWAKFQRQKFRGNVLAAHDREHSDNCNVFVKTCQTAHAKLVNFILYKLYLNKVKNCKALSRDLLYVYCLLNFFVTMYQKMELLLWFINIKHQELLNSIEFLYREKKFRDCHQGFPKFCFNLDFAKIFKCVIILNL